MSMHSEILNKLVSYDWFCDVGVDEYQRQIIYVHYMNIEIIKLIQECCGNVLIYFIASNPENLKKYVRSADIDPITERDPAAQLTSQLRELQQVYSNHFLLDIFYEVHDGKNAVTNLSATFPQVREKIENLYNTYGFDVIYDQLM